MQKGKGESDSNCWTSPSGAGFKMYLKDSAKLEAGKKTSIHPYCEPAGDSLSSVVQIICSGNLKIVSSLMVLTPSCC
ncbi:hypothetical protein Hdeb2414_s1033g00975161 [Helianthus debilis subsp. tardiflorus]